MRFWARIFTDKRMQKDAVVENTDDDTRTHKVFKALEKICHDLDLSGPIWLESNIADFKRFSKVRFTQDNFIEEIPFDYLEFLVLEED